MKQTKDAYWAQWEKLLEAAAEIQGLAPDAVLLGGSTAATHLKHRYSFDADHVLTDLKEKYEEILDFLEDRNDWETARVHPPKLILGNFRGVETGIRQLIRRRPLETERFEIKGKKFINLPTLAEMLRTKAWMIISRNTARDFIDFAALVPHLGIEASVRTLEDLDDYYADIIRGRKASPLIQLIRQLAEPAPADLDRVDLSRYKGIKAPFDSWDRIENVCERVSVELGQTLARSDC